MTFDPKDKKYQVSEEFPPNKEDTWAYPMEKDGWVHAHNSLRMEMAKVIEAVNAAQSRGKVKAWEVKCLQTAWNAHFEHIHAHHENEDDKFVPFLKTRFHYPEKCVTDHDGLVKALDNLKGMIDNLKEGDTLEKVALNLKAYQDMMLPHLKDEEDRCLPLMRAYFTPKDVAPIIQELMSQGGKIEGGSFIACMGERTFREEFMRQEKIPFFVWYIAFKGLVKYYKKQFLDPIAALKSGEEPVPPSFCWGIFKFM